MTTIDSETPTTRRETPGHVIPILEAEFDDFEKIGRAHV